MPLRETMCRTLLTAMVLALLLAGLGLWLRREVLDASRAALAHPPPPATGAPETAPRPAGAKASTTSARPASGEAALPPPPAAPPLAFTTAPHLPESAGRGIVGHWQGRFATPLHARGPGPDDDFHLPLRFDLPLNATRRVPVLITRHDVTGPAAGVFTGTVAERPGSLVVLSYVGSAQAGVVQLPEERRSFVISGDDDGHVRITENDLSQAPGCTAPLQPPRS